MSASTPLSEAVSEIEENARAKQNAEQIDQKVTVARSLISNLNADIETLADDVQKLQFYREILDRAFGVSPPGDASITEARLAVDKDQEQLVQDLVESGLDLDDEAGQISGGPEFESYKRDIREAQQAVSRDIDAAKNKLEMENEHVRPLAARALGLIGDTRAVDPLADDPPVDTCPACGATMSSAGRDQGYRCRDCRTSADGKVERPIDRTLEPGWYEVPPVARRHIAKPLVRGGFDGPTHPER